MQTPTLHFTHVGDDYEVIVRTQDITYSWQRFRGRIDYTRRTNPAVNAPREYCEYTSQDECQLELEKPFLEAPTERQQEILLKNGTKWSNLWPVMYETCMYQINVLFYDVEGLSLIHI